MITYYFWGVWKIIVSDIHTYSGVKILLCVNTIIYKTFPYLIHVLHEWVNKYNQMWLYITIMHEDH